MANAQRIQRTLETAIGHFQSGNLDGAAELCSGLLNKQPKNHHALHILGAVRLKQNDPATAIKLLKSAAKRDPRNAEILANLGAAYRMSRDPNQAIAALKKAVGLDPLNVSAKMNLGNAASDAGDPETAVEAYSQVVALRPDHLDARSALARQYQDLGQSGPALAQLRTICDSDPQDPDPVNRMGILLAEAGDHDQAIEYLRRALVRAPENPDIRMNLANVLALNFAIDEAVALYDEALSKNADCPDLLCNLGNALSRAGRRQEAADCYRNVIAVHPDHADAHASLDNNLLADGTFREGWSHYLYRPSTRAVSENLHRTPLPDDLSGKRVAVIADQGLGDQVFFARFLPGLGLRGAETVYRPEARLADMLTRAEIADEIAPEKASLDAEYIVSAGDLPFLLGSGSSELPHPYPIPAHPERLAKLQDILSDFGPPPWTGVTWRAGTANVRLALSKEIPVAELAGAMRNSAGTQIVIQRNCASDELAEYQSIVERPVLDLSHFNDDIEDLLALSSALDRYVGVSNTITHLRAAALKPSDVLVPIPAEFRWMNAGSVSPWFPMNEIFRQLPDGSWRAACNALSQKLET